MPGTLDSPPPLATYWGLVVGFIAPFLPGFLYAVLTGRDLDLPDDPVAEPVQVLGLGGELLGGRLPGLKNERPGRHPRGHGPGHAHRGGHGAHSDDRIPPT